MGSIPWWEQRHQWESDCIELRGMYIREYWFGGQDFFPDDKWIESFVSRRPKILYHATQSDSNPYSQPPLRDSLSCVDDVDNCQSLSATSPKSVREALTGWFQTCPSHKESINVSLFRQLLAILLAYAAAINDPCGLCCFFRNRLGQPFSYRGMYFLCLLCGGDFTRTDSPNWFISDNNLGPICRLCCDRFELGGHNFDGLVAFPLLYVYQLKIQSDIDLRLHTSRVSPMHNMTPRPPSSAAFVLLAINYVQARSCQYESLFTLTLTPLH